MSKSIRDSIKQQHTRSLRLLEGAGLSVVQIAQYYGEGYPANMNIAMTYAKAIHELYDMIAEWGLTI